MQSIQCKLHDQTIKAFCYSQKCERQRRLCLYCIEEHIGHQKTFLKKDDKQAAIQRLKMHFSPNNYHDQAQYRIDALFTALQHKFDHIVNAAEKLKLNCLNNHLKPMGQLIINSFKQNGHQISISIMTENNIKKDQMNLIAKAIRCFDKKHFKNIQILEKSLEIMKEELEKSLDKNLEVMMNQIEKSLKQWSLFEVQDYQAIVKEKEEKKIKIINQLYQLQKVQAIKKQQQLANLAKKNSWNPIANLIQGSWFSRPKLDKFLTVTKLQMIGNNIPSTMFQIKPTISKNLTKIEGIEVMTSLKELHLQYNNITKIQNLTKLKNLEELWLDSNKIKKIENLQTLTKLKKLGLNDNQITKIQNLQTLTLLQYLDLSDNPIAKSKQNKIQAQKYNETLQFCNIENYQQINSKIY